MPQTEVKFYQDDNGTAPVLEWIKSLKGRQKVAFDKCIQLLQDLRDHGHELQYPTSENLRDGLYELRAHDDNVQLRILYFFDKRGRNIAIAAHGFRKESKKQQDKEIECGRQRRNAFLKNPDKHIYAQEIEGQNDEDDD